MTGSRTKRSARRNPASQEVERLSKLFNQGFFAEAELLATSLTQRYPSHGFGWKVLGVIYQEQNRFDESLVATRKAITLLPEDAATHNNLGAALLGLGRLTEAEASIQRALTIAPGYAKALSNLGTLLQRQGCIAEAETYLRKAVEANPGNALTHIRLGNTLELQNKLHAAHESYRDALNIKPEMKSIHSDLLHLMSLDAKISPQQLFAEHAVFGDQLEANLREKWQPHNNIKDPTRHLHIGFVTADLYNHALANYLEPVFGCLADKTTLSLYIYYTNTNDDAVTRRLRDYLPNWNVVGDLSDEELATQIHEDQIDILIDLNGHTVLNRLQTFARRPAPVQVSWLGYLGTTGLQSMDYYVADPYWIPPGELDWQFTEKVAYLPTVVVFEPNHLSPPVNSLPALANVYITFGSFNRQNKINEAVIGLWSTLLRHFPNSKMVLAAIPPEHQDGIIQMFEREGIEESRLTFFGRVAQTDYLALHHQVDFCLDTFPFGGGATTAHAAWMGIPTLCLVGQTPASRFCATELHHLGLDAFIATSAEDFVAKGIYWAEHVSDLSDIRQGMRARFSASPLAQYAEYADHFEAMLRTMWQRWCGGLPPITLSVDMNAVNVDRSAPIETLEPPARDLRTLRRLYEQKKLEETESFSRELMCKFPGHGLARKLLGSVLHQLGRSDESLAVHKATVEARPDDYEAHFNLASEFQQLGLLDDAVRSYICAIGLAPNAPNAYCNLGNIFKTMGLFPEAEVYCRQAIALQPTMENAHNNLGNALHAQGKYEESLAAYRQALVLRPNWAEAFNNLAITLKDQGHGSEAKEAYRKALQLKPNWAAAQSNLLYSLSLDLHTSPEQLHAEHMKFGQQFEPSLRTDWKKHTNSKAPNKVLHIGFVSGDLYDHALTNFLEPAFAFLAKKEDLVLHAYYTHIYDDAATKRMRTSFAHWNSVAGLSEGELAERIRADGIDILFDLAGHTAHNRLLTFARKPAPIQVSWLGYLGTSGLQAMDYYLCDKFWIPPGELDWQFSEKPAYLPTAIIFQPSPLAPEVNALPALESGHITFGSFNRTNKLNPSVIVLWSMLLREVPEAQMVFGGIPTESQVELFHRFSDEGIEPNRLTFYPRSNLQEYLALHHQVDFCLDTFPYGGGATTAHAAWMGVPSLSLAGESPASRFGASAMHHLGLDGFIATSIDDYLAKGRYWAEHTAELAVIRQGMRERFNQSALGQHATFADNLDALLRTMWQRWCDDLPPALIELDSSPKIRQTSASPEPLNPTDQELDTLANLYEQQRYPEAETLARTLTERFPQNGFAWGILGYIYQAQERFNDALQPLIQYTSINPKEPTTYVNLGMVLAALNRLPEAEVNLRKALNIAPNYGKAAVNLGMVLRLQGQFQESEQWCRQALEIDSCDASARIQLGNALEDQGRLSEAQASYYRADMAHEPRRAVAASNVLYLLNHDVLVEPQHLFAEHLAFGEAFETPLRSGWRTHSNDKDPTRQLQVGFVSGDFCHHALTDFLEPAFEAMGKRPGLVLHAYYSGTREDAVTQRMRAYFVHWHPVAQLSDVQLAEHIRADGIDILIDLSGHTAKNRLLTFARKPAPVQMSWLGYLGTTGLQAMDYYVCDAYWIPPGGLDWQFVEKMAYLPSAAVFEPSPLTPPVNELPALRNGYITFGSFNRVTKINDSVIALWSMVMQNAKKSQLVLAGIEAASQQTITTTFAEHGINVSRLKFFPRLATADYLALHQEVDICLDTFPHGGGATTTHAAWMGIPTLCLAGETPASRFSATLMHHMGLDDFVTSSIDDYLAKSRYWLLHIDELATIRKEMRKRFHQSPLNRHDAFAQNFETLLRTKWQHWCSNLLAQPTSTSSLSDTNPLASNIVAIKDVNQTLKLRIEIVSATKLTETDFWTRSALGISLKHHLKANDIWSVSVAFENSTGLSEIFNDRIDRATDDTILVFIHDDVWIDDAEFSNRVIAGLSAFDVIGVAGNTRLLPNQPAWCFVDPQFTWDEKKYLSGRVAHGPAPLGPISVFGPVPQECELLDGLFIAAKRNVLKNKRVRFDPAFTFHFYDMDFCRSARKAGLRLGTWPISLTHQSGGAFGSALWVEKYRLYLAKWNDSTFNKDMQMTSNYIVGTLDCIETLQIYSKQQAITFEPRWKRELDYIRFELVSLPAGAGETIAIDLTLRSDDGRHSFIVIGIIMLKKGKLCFPSLLNTWSAENLQCLTNKINAELNNAPKPYEIRALHPTPRLQVEEMTIERVLPGFRDYTTAVNHIKRYTFLLDYIQAGSILECACGTGYGAAIFARKENITRYMGLDLSPVATVAAQGNVVFDPRFSFHNIDLANPQAELFQNVISLETIEHTQNPYQFLELLIEKMAPEGQLLLSLPTEIWGGSHRNPYHLSNWTRERLVRFLDQYFEDITIFTQKLSLLGPNSFEASEICDSYPNEDADECFVTILKKPRIKKRQTIVVKRLNALGDVIWITPILHSLRRQHPFHNLLVVTNSTDVFINNPDVDLVLNPSYIASADDLLINLDGAYEQRRSLHLLPAYANVCGIALNDNSPRLFPTAGQRRHCASIIGQRFQPLGATRLLAVHMAASSPDRVWPKTSWKDLIQDLLAADSELGIVVLGRGKDYTANDIKINSPRALCLTHQLELMETAAVLSFCDVLVAPDSGVLHIAAAMQTPYLGLFGMADPSTRMPLAGASQAIWADITCKGCLQLLPPEAAPRCHLGKAVCMDAISPKQVFQKLTCMLAGNVPNRWITRASLAFQPG